MGIGRPAGITQASGMIGDVLTRTNGDLTYYVRTTGDDGNDGLSAGNAFLTVNEALDRIPRHIKHDITVDVGSGSFTTFDITGFNIELGGSLTVEGKLATPSLDGLDSGTATGGSVIQLIDTGGGWTTDELRGLLVKIGDDYRVVRENTGTIVNFGSNFPATCSGKAYEILEIDTTVTGTSGLGFGPIGVCDNKVAQRDLYIRNFKTTTGTVGLFAFTTDLGIVERIYTSGAYYGVGLQTVGGEPKLFEVYATGCTYGIWSRTLMNFKESRLGSYNNTGSGFYMDMNVATSNITGFFDNNGEHGIEAVDTAGIVDVESYFYAKDNTLSGIKLHNCSSFDIDSGTLEDNGAYGLEVDDDTVGNRSQGSFANLVGDITIQNNTDGGIIMRNRSGIALTNVDGSGNGNYGLELKAGSYALVTLNTGITGDTGDVVIDGEAFTWATDFSSDGDVVMDLTSGCRIERRD